jgi:anti-sigma regulatory factor (Ser/Thr protein kinase)
VYASPEELTAAVAEVVEDAAGDAGQVLVVAREPSLGVLRSHLDGRAGLVTWANMSSMGLNPGRLIPAFRVFAEEHPGRMAWCVQEPAWPGRSREELDEVIRHEALMNLAFAGGRPRVLCPYAAGLGDEVIARVERTHPVVVRDGQVRRGASCAAPRLIPEDCDRPLSSPPANAGFLPYRDELGAVRRFIAEGAHRAGLPPDRVRDLVLAISELTANTIAHTTGPGSVTMWAVGGELLCQVDDAGQIADPLAGRRRADPAAPGGSRGLWMVQQLCDLVEIRVGAAGNTIRLHMRLSGVAAWR